jgi:hypothetical protein
MFGLVVACILACIESSKQFGLELHVKPASVQASRNVGLKVSAAAGMAARPQAASRCELGWLAGCLYTRLCRRFEWRGGRRSVRTFLAGSGLLMLPFIVACSSSAFV